MSGREAATAGCGERPLRAGEVAERLGVSADTVNMLADAGELPGSWRVGRQRHLRVPPGAVDAYIRENLAGESRST